MWTPGGLFLNFSYLQVIEIRKGVGFYPESYFSAVRERVVRDVEVLFPVVVALDTIALHLYRYRVPLSGRYVDLGAPQRFTVALDDFVDAEVVLQGIGARDVIVVSVPVAPDRAAALVVFILSLGELGAPLHLRVNVYAVVVFQRLADLTYDPRGALVFSLPMVLVSAAAAAALFFWLRPGMLKLISRKSVKTVPLFKGGASTAVLSCAGAIPLVLLAGLAVRGINFREAWDIAAGSAFNSAATALSAAMMMILFLLFACARRGRRMSGFVQLAWLLGLCLPASVIGQALVTAFNRDLWLQVYGTPLMIVLGNVARYGFLAMLPMLAAFGQLSRSWDEAAASGGAGWLTRLIRIRLPLALPGVFTAACVGALFSLKDFQTSMSYIPPGFDLLPVRLVTWDANGDPATVAGIALMHVVMTVAILALTVVGSFLAQRRRLGFA